MKLIVNSEYERAVESLQTFVRTPHEVIKVADYDEYRSLVHESGLVEAIGTVLLCQQSTKPIPNLDNSHQYHASNSGLSVWAEYSQHLASIRTKRRGGAGVRFNHNLYLHRSEQTVFGDLASRNVGTESTTAYTWDASYKRPRPVEDLNRVLEYGQLAISQFLKLTTV